MKINIVKSGQPIHVSRRQLLKSLLVVGSVALLPPLAKKLPASPLYAGTTDLKFAWVGAVTASSATIKLRVDNDNYIVRLQISTQADMSDPFYTPYYAAIGNRDGIVTFVIQDLVPTRRYHYMVEVNSVLDSTKQGSFQTFSEAPYSFQFAFSSCAETGSNHRVFDTIREMNPLFFLHTGDMHYTNIETGNFSNYRQAYNTVLDMPRQANLYRQVPLVYTWDDHDYGPNGSNSESLGRTAARLTYQEYVPHYPLAAGSGDVPIYHAFTVGRVRFLVTDSRSMRSPHWYPDDGNKTMLGEAQIAWWKQELLAAQEVFPLIVWVNTVPWISSETGGDSWSHYQRERQHLADFIKENDIQGLCMVSGDAHMIAIDDSTNSDYASAGGAGFPVIHAASLDQGGSVKGGPYSEGTIPGRGQFGTMTVQDVGSHIIQVEWQGWNADGEVLISHEFSVDAPYSPSLYLPAILKK